MKWFGAFGLAVHCLLAAAQAAPPTSSASADRSFPLRVAIESTFESDLSGITPPQRADAARIGVALPYFAMFRGKINGEDHWVMSCRKENVLRESIPCGVLPTGEYRGRWIHDYRMLELVGNSTAGPIDRYVDVVENDKSPPPPDDPVFNEPVFDFSVQFPGDKRVKDYPILVHVFGGAALEFPAGQLPARGSCSVQTWSPYQTNVSCTAYPPIEIHRGYVTLDVSARRVAFAHLNCEASWRWSHCSVLDPGLYYARRDKNHLVLLTHDQAGKPREVAFTVTLPPRQQRLQ